VSASHVFAVAALVWAGSARATLAVPEAGAPPAEPPPPAGGLVAAHRACHALAQVRGLRVPLVPALLGDKAAFPVIAAQADRLTRSVLGAEGSPAAPTLVRIERNTVALVSRQDAITKHHELLRTLRAAAPDLLREVEDLMSGELAAGASLRVAAASQLMMLTQRLGKSAGEAITLDGVNPESLFLLGKDTESFLRLARSLQDGNAEFRLPRTTAVDQRKRLSALIHRVEPIQQDMVALQPMLKDLVAAREAQAQLLADTLTLDRALEPLCSLRVAP